MVPLRHYVGGYYKYFFLPTNKGSGGEGEARTRGIKGNKRRNISASSVLPNPPVIEETDEIPASMFEHYQLQSRHNKGYELSNLPSFPEAVK